MGGHGGGRYLEIEDGHPEVADGRLKVWYVYSKVWDEAVEGRGELVSPCGHGNPRSHTRGVFQVGRWCVRVLSMGG